MGDAPPPPLRDSTPCRPKGPLCIILRYPFLVTDPKMFLKAPLRQYILILSGSARRKNAIFFGKNFQKSPLFWPIFFHNFACGAEISAKTGSLFCFGSSENQFGRPKKMSTNFEIPPPPPPPPEKILDPPLV